MKILLDKNRGKREKSVNDQLAGSWKAFNKFAVWKQRRNLL